jgi:hypothetical protein
MATKSTIVLCEDETHWLFVYRWLLAKGSMPNEMVLVPLPAGRGAGFAHVVSRYAQEMREYRRKANHLQSRRLIVVLDGDVSTVQQRLAALAAELDRTGLAARDAAERVCILVPCRNGETWLHFFHGHPVNETADYKSLYAGDAKALACGAAGTAFAGWLQAPPAPGSPPRSWRRGPRRVASECAASRSLGMSCR